MKNKKVIGILIVIITLILATTAGSIKTYAAESSYYLGITNVRESKDGKGGAAYGIGGLKADGNPFKKVWKIVSYPTENSTIPNYANSFYCIKAEHGFVNEANPNISGKHPLYNTKLNMKTQSADVITKLNAINSIKNDPQLTSEIYNKIMWIIDNMYIPSSATAAKDKETLLSKAEIIGPNGYEDGNLLTDDDIEVVQQLAIWYYTNPNDTNYHVDDTKGEPKLQTIYFNNWNGQDSNYASFEDLYNDPVADTRLGLTRQNQAEDLYKYLIKNAKSNYQSSNTVVSPITLNKLNFTAIQVGEEYIIGPLNINIDTSRNYNITELTFKDQNGNTISLTGENKLLNSNKQIINSGNINDVIGQDFYISLPITTKITRISFSIKATYNTREATYYTTDLNTYVNEQPVVLVENQTKNYSDNISITIPEPRNIDLALRKSITKIDGVAPQVSRLPIVDTTNLENGTSKTATYNHTKNALKVETNNIIEYTLTVYNEGKKDGYAAEIKDYLPAGIEFIELVSPQGKYSANAIKNENGTTTVTITNIGKTVLNKYTSGELASEALTIKCKITKEANTQDQRLVNIAEITKYFDSESNIQKTKDIDSESENFPNDKKNNSYNGNGQIGNYIPGQEDDDDFETVILPGKYFDLALRKFITKINGETLATSRIPQVDLTKLISGESTTATYNHPKAPVSVKIGDIVTYTIRVYNEGQFDGYAEEITDHLPEMLEFLPQDEENISNGWVYDENDISLRTIKTNHLSKDIDVDNIIKAFNGKELDYKDIQVKCKVKSTAKSGDKITNIAQITGFTDKNGRDIIDRDSIKNNIKLPTDQELLNYKDEEIVRGDKYIPGQEDDDDFEKIKIQVFDLALRKFITAVDNKSITSRIPVPTMSENGNIKYNHTKEPVEVQNGNIVTYTLRIFNEGDISGYASEITDDLPEGLLFLPDNDLNKTYRWKMIDKDGNETEDVEKAVKVTTDYLSKEQEKENSSNLIEAYNKEVGITNKNPDYKDIKISFKVTEPSTSVKILTNIAQISDDQDENGNPIEDIDSIPGNNNMEEDDIDVEHVKLVYFDLALRKFITKVDNLDVNNRYPVLSVDKDGKIKYTHTKEPVEVENGNIVTYTIRVYNEGKMAGYAAEVTDNLPEGLLFLPDNDLNKTYRWKMIDKDGKETDDVTKAVKITTDYLSKEQEKQEGENLLKAFNNTLGISNNNPDYRDVKIAFKVTEPETSDRILINTAEISEDTDKEGDPVEDIDSTPGNNKEGEDDIDIEKVKVKYFDLALKKWVTQSIVIEDGKQTVTNTGHTGDENPEPIVKVDLKDKLINKVTVKFRYKIRVTNEGQIEGYVKEIKDYIPEGLKFVKEDNPDWTEVKEGVVATKKLENTLLRPGESATVEILLTWINGVDNLGKKVNIAEISKDHNNSNTPDIDSTPDNFKPGEDDIDDAPVILSVKTGETEVYIGLTTIVLVTLAGGIYLIKKYVL